MLIKYQVVWASPIPDTSLKSINHFKIKFLSDAVIEMKFLYAFNYIWCTFFWKLVYAFMCKRQSSVIDKRTKLHIRWESFLSPEIQFNLYFIQEREREKKDHERVKWNHFVHTFLPDGDWEKKQMPEMNQISMMF